MILYHGSNQPIDSIDLSQGKKFKDFGQGFYTTHLKDHTTIKRINIEYRMSQYIGPQIKFGQLRKFY